ncbi:MAG: class I SAM-dependent methyltransferase, partial [Anaerolineae bacterium]
MKKDPSKQKLKKLGHPQAAHRHPAETSWERAHEWYDKIVGQTGHYYHENIILPNFLRLCAFEKTKKPASLLDLACGQGVISRHLPPGVSYLGIDAAPSLIKAAKKYQNAPTHTFLEKDVTHPLKLDKREFTHASIILALQNI